MKRLEGKSWNRTDKWRVWKGKSTKIPGKAIDEWRRETLQSISLKKHRVIWCDKHSMTWEYHWHIMWIYFWCPSLKSPSLLFGDCNGYICGYECANLQPGWPPCTWMMIPFFVIIPIHRSCQQRLIVEGRNLLGQTKNIQKQCTVAMYKA